MTSEEGERWKVKYIEVNEDCGDLLDKIDLLEDKAGRLEENLSSLIKLISEKTEELREVASQDLI